MFEHGFIQPIGARFSFRQVSAGKSLSGSLYRPLAGVLTWLLRAGFTLVAGATPCPIGFWNGLLLFGWVADGYRTPFGVALCRDDAFDWLVPCAEADEIAPSATRQIASFTSFMVLLH